MKNRMKTIVAFLCVLTLSVGAMSAWTPAKEVKATEASTDPTPVYLEGFKHVTLEDFGLTEKTYDKTTYAQLKDSNGTSVTGTFDKTLLSLKVQFTPGGDNRCSPLMIGGNGMYTGFAFSPNNAGTAVGIIEWFRDTPDLKPMTEEPNVANEQVGVLYANDVSADFNFKNEFTLQISFEYTTENNQTYLTLTFYINGKDVQINERLTSGTSQARVSSLKMKISSEKKYHGNYIGFDTSGLGGTLKMSSVVPENDKLASMTWSDFVATKAVDESAYLDGYKHVTLGDFTNSGNPLKDGVYSANTEAYSLKDLTGTTVGDLDNTLVSFNIQCKGSPYFLIGGNATSRGIGIVPSGSGNTLQFVNYNNGTDNQLITGADSSQVFARVNVTPNYTGQDQGATENAAYNVEQLKQEDKNFNFQNTEFLLQLSFDYYDSDSNGTKDKLKLGVYVNGKLMKLEFADKTTTDKEYAKLDEDGKVEAPVYYYDVTDAETSVTTSKSNHGTYIQLVSMATNNITLSSTKITLPNKAFLKSSQEAYKLQDSDLITQLGNTSFEGRVTFLSASDNDMIYYGGGEAGYGLRLSAYNNGEQLKLHLGSDELYLDAATADVTSFLNNEFRLKITTEYADYDGDNDSNDIQLGIYINGELYNNRYLYAYDITDAGNYVTIYSDESDESDSKGIMVRSVSDVTDVTYDLAGDAYTADAIETAFGTVTEVRLGETVVEVGDGLTLAGDYTLYSDEELVGELVLYKAGDVHLDNVTDVRDLVAMKKVNANIDSITWAATMGAYKADFSETTICNIILGIETQ